MAELTTNILCEEEQTLLTDFFEEFSDLLQDSDNKEEKEKVKIALQKMTDTTMYMVLGEEGTGKTSLLNVIFQGIFQAQDTIYGDICEYKWGEQNFEAPVADGIQRKFLSSDSMKGLSVLDTKGINRIGQKAFEKIKDYAAKCSVIFVVFDAGNIGSPRIWDFVENISDQKMVFFLTKCDLVTQEVLESNIEKVKSNMKDAGIFAPFFAVSIKETMPHCGVSDLDSVRIFLRQQVIGENPILKKQLDNVQEIQTMLRQLQVSFRQRQKQYESDIEILEKINGSLDAYILNHEQVIRKFTEKLAEEINKDIDSYEAEIISKMDPYKIKERFQTKDDFLAYLDMINDNYKTMMNDSVNRKTIGVMKDCLHDLERLFQEAAGYFNERKNILDAKDRFYGTLSQSRRQISVKTKETALMAGEFYQTLSGASEELFSAIWKERETYDRKINTRDVLSRMIGGSAGAAGGAAGWLAIAKGVAAAATKMAAGGGVVASAAAGEGAAVGLITGVLTVVPIIGIGVIVGVAVMNTMAKTLYDPRAAAKMEKNTQECILKFKTEVDKTRKIMIRDVTEQITVLFKKELEFVDGSFTDFRLSVNIEGEKLPVLQKQIETAEALSERIGQLEEERNDAK